VWINKIGKIFYLLVFFTVLCRSGNRSDKHDFSGKCSIHRRRRLDISAAMGPDTRIGWWASAADITTTSPTNTIDLTGRITRFMVNPSEFDGYPGNSYRAQRCRKTDGIAWQDPIPGHRSRVLQTAGAPLQETLT